MEPDYIYLMVSRRYFCQELKRSILPHILDNGAKMSPKRRTFLSLVFACICLSK